MTGDPRWFDRLEATVRHIIDIDVCHASKEHPDWVGSIHAYNGTNHTTAGPWNAMQRTKGTLAYWRLTGDIDARDAALGVADSAVRAQRAVGAGSVRDHAGVLYCLTAAYDETRESKYLEAAKRVAHDAMKRIDARRGCYSEIHGNVSYRGNVPWMCAQLAEPMYDYYVQSGDLDAANTVVGLAESILTDNRTRDVPGDVYGYSHNPHFNKTSNYHILIAPSVLYAYELTGDRFFLEQARAMYRQTIRENTVNTITNCYWNTPTLLYYLQAHGLSEGKHP
jgi:rhamnogalacturonyl hydrolase YesR